MKISVRKWVFFSFEALISSERRLVFVQIQLYSHNDMHILNELSADLGHDQAAFSLTDGHFQQLVEVDILMVLNYTALMSTKNIYGFQIQYNSFKYKSLRSFYRIIFSFCKT